MACVGFVECVGLFLPVDSLGELAIRVSGLYWWWSEALYQRHRTGGAIFELIPSLVDQVSRKKVIVYFIRSISEA